MAARQGPLSERIRVLISSSDELLGEYVIDRLSPARFDVSAVRPGVAVLDAIRRQRPHIAVLDRVHERLEAAQMEIAVVKDVCPDARIIVVSEASSASDAQIVEAGVFFYLAERSSPPAELLRVIEAAARSTVKPGSRT